jgi:hypothetical protein
MIGIVFWAGKICARFSLRFHLSAHTRSSHGRNAAQTIGRHEHLCVPICLSNERLGTADDHNSLDIGNDNHTIFRDSGKSRQSHLIQNKAEERRSTIGITKQ